MLRHDLYSEETTPLPQRRITPDELKRAVTALDARRKEQERQQEEEARYLSETLSLEQATSTLSLDYTPEEIWAEVKQEREQFPHTETKTEAEPGDNAAPAQIPYHTLGDEANHCDYPTPARQSSSESNAYLPVAIAGITILGLIAGFASCGQNGQVSSIGRPPYIQNNVPFHQPFNPATPDVRHELGVATILGHDFYSKLRQSQGPSPRYHIFRVPLFPPDCVREGETLYPERAIPDGYSVYVSGRPFSPAFFGRTAIVFHAADDANSTYGFSPSYSYDTRAAILTTRYSGQTYVRCWVRGTDAHDLKANRPVTLYRTRETAAGVEPTDLVPVTIPVGGSPTHASLDLLLFAEKLTYGHYILGRSLESPPHVQMPLDKHAWEDFAAVSLPPYQPPAWAKLPGVFSDYDSISYAQCFLYTEFDGSSEVRTFHQVPDRQPFHCGLDIFREFLAAINRNADVVANGAPSPTPLSQVLVDVRPDLHQPYTFVKIDGNLYLRGWVETVLTQGQMRDHAVAVHNDPTDPELGYAPKRIQLRLDRCRIDSQTVSDNASERTVPVTDVHLDRHAWEKW